MVAHQLRRWPWFWVILVRSKWFCDTLVLKVILSRFLTSGCGWFFVNSEMVLVGFKLIWVVPVGFQ